MSGVPRSPMAYVKPDRSREHRMRFELAMAWAGSRPVPRMVTCHECGRTIAPPRHCIGEFECPTCMSCVEATFIAEPPA